MHPITKTKGKITLKPESISIIEIQTPWDISGNKKHHLNPKAYLPQAQIYIICALPSLLPRCITAVFTSVKPLKLL